LYVTSRLNLSSVYEEKEEKLTVHETQHIMRFKCRQKPSTSAYFVIIVQNMAHDDTQGAVCGPFDCPTCTRDFTC